MASRDSPREGRGFGGGAPEVFDLVLVESVERAGTWPALGPVVGGLLVRLLPGPRRAWFRASRGLAAWERSGRAAGLPSGGGAAPAPSGAGLKT